MITTSIQESLGAAVIGAIIAFLGFVAKSIYELWNNVRKIKADRLANIIYLSTLLNTSRVIFLVQNRKARELLKLLKMNHPKEFVENEGFESVFSMLYDKFLPEEIEKHTFIRNYTKVNLRPINTAMLAWLQNDTLFRTTYISAKDEKKRLLANKLIELHIHLLLWEGKYNAWIHDNPKHALVYLADEEKHGIGFPKGLDELVQDVMSELKKSAPIVPVVKVGKEE